MPRISRNKLIGKYFHVIVQGLNKEFIFENSFYMRKYKEIIISKLDNSRINILVYCIMNNHAHFLIHCEKIQDLSKYMQKINTSYSRFYNKEKNRVGYVFRDRFYTQEILDINQLYKCMRYIHNNPVKAHIVNNMSEYKFSSYNEFIDINNTANIINKKSISLLFDSSNNYFNMFIKIHKTSACEDFIDIDEKEKDINSFILEVEKKYKKKITDFKYNKLLLKDIILNAREQTNVTIEQLALILDVSKSTVGRYCKK